MSICDTGYDRKQYFGKYSRIIQKNMSRSLLSLSQDLSIKTVILSCTSQKSVASFSEANTNIVEESRGESLCELVPVHRPAQTVTYVISNLYVGR